MCAPALEARPFVWGRLTVDGELDRVDEWLGVGLLSVLTDSGSLEEPLAVVGFRVACLRATGRAECDLGTSLCERA